MNWTLLKLESNFRCGSAICDTANRLMAHQPDRPDKQTISATGQTGQVVVKSDGFETDDQEAHAVAQDILDVSVLISMARDCNAAEAFNDCAVLVRTNFIADYFRNVLKAHGLPVREKAKADLPADWQRAKAALALLANPDNDRLAFQAVALASGRQKAEEVRARALAEYKTINDLALFMPANFVAGQAVEQLARMGVSRESLDRIGRVAGLLAPDSPVGDLVLAVGREAAQEDEGAGIACCTLHSAKGKEWEAVWIPAIEAHLFPCPSEDESESRRLLFVGITRAKSYCWLSWARRRAAQWGEPKASTASRFIAECQQPANNS